ncbi:putative ribonuclease H-like domain-containing protein [Tanacetum coccineum]
MQETLKWKLNLLKNTLYCQKKFAQCTEDLLLQAGAARATSTNTINTVSTPISTASPSNTFSAGGPDLNNNDQDDSQIPALEDIYDNPSDEIFTNASYDDEGAMADFTNLETIVNIEPKKISQALEDESWVDAMQEELLQFKIQKVWILVDLPFGKKAIGTKWVYRNKKDKRDYDEVFAPVARIEAIGIFLAFASYMGFIVYQMDVKSAFLYGTIDEEVYMSQPPGFVDPKFPKKVFKVVKALYGLHQAPKAWYATLSTFLLKSGYRRGTINKTLFIKKNKNDIMSSRKKMDKEAADVDVHLYRSIIGSLMYLTASRPDIMFAVCACSRFQVTSKTSHLHVVKRIFSDYAKANLDRKSITKGCQFLGRRLISWQCKKQTIVATSTTEAEYVAAANCYGQNPVFHSKTKHIEIRHHFIRDAYEKKLIHVLKIHTDDNVADLLTKAFDVSRNLEAKKKFLMYPRFVQVFLNNQLQNIPAPLDNLPIPVLSKKVFTNMTRRGLHFLGHVTPLFSTMLVPAAVEEGEGSGTHTEPQPTPSPTQPSVGDQTYVTESSSRPENTQNSRKTLEGSGRNDGDQVQLPYDSPLSGGHTSERAEEILKLKTRIKKLDKKCKPNISYHRAWLRSVSILSMKKKLGKKESISKQGRKNAKLGPTLDGSAFNNLNADGMDYIDTEEAVNEGRHNKETEELNVTHDIEVLEKGGSNEEQVNAAGNIGVSTAVPEVSTVNISTTRRLEVSTATPMTPLTTTSVFYNEDITLAETLVKMKDGKAKLKGVAIKEVKESDRPARSVLTLKPLPKIDPKDKGKGVLEEEHVPAKKLKKSDLDAAQLAMDKDSEEHVGRYTYSKLRNKKFDELQVLYEKAKSIQDFVPIGSAEDERLIEKMNKQAAGEDTSKKEKVLEEPNSTKMEVKQEEVEVGTRKRPGSPRMKRMSNRKKTYSDLEEEEYLKTFLKIVLDEEGIVDYKVLEKRFPIINWESKFYHYDRHGAEGIYYRIFRSDGSSRWIKTFFEIVTRFDRLDLVELYNLVMRRFETTTPEGVDLVLWGDLRTMFDANAEDEFWQNQERWNLKNWDFYKNCGVHTLILEDGTEIHILAERKYPLTKETIEKMMYLKLVVETVSDSAYDLLRFIQKQIDESGSYDGSKKDL